MIEGLMRICRISGAPECNPEVSKQINQQETGLGQTAHMWPNGDGQRRLDEICMTCEHRVFEIETSECPNLRKQILSAR